MIVADSHRKVKAIPLKLNLKLKSESEAKSHHEFTVSLKIFGMWHLYQMNQTRGKVFHIMMDV